MNSTRKILLFLLFVIGTTNVPTVAEQIPRRQRRHWRRYHRNESRSASRNEKECEGSEAIKLM
jgi:hypothetical protein